MSKRKGYKKPKVEVHSDECGSGYEHYHPPGRKTIYGTKGGHGFILKKFTAVGLIGDCWYAEALDIFNPVSDVVDIIELFEDEEE
ncbi:MAG: hypothetical protein J6S51_04200 [Kiritimatiellae bacterium]|nr:hypothetical protein [Kiritimatiellia bacterium]